MKKVRILIVEDEFIIAETIRNNLIEMGYEVTSHVDSGEELIKRVPVDSPDVILMDISLKGKMDGIEASRRIKESSNTPVIFLTAHLNAELLERAKITEPFGYIVKPFKASELKANIEIALYKKKMEDSLRELNRNLEAKVKEEIERNRKQEQLLIQQSKLASIGEMIGAIAHQWKQPLNALGLLVQDIREAYNYGELNKEYIDKTVDESLNQINFMSDTIDDFRNFFKVSKKEVSFDLFNAINAVIKLVLPQFKSSGIFIQYNCAKEGKKESSSEGNTQICKCAEPHLITGYPNEFKQAVLNIITNAKDAILERRQREENSQQLQGAIIIDVSSDTEKDIITIQDNGGGIPNEIMNRIFDPYFTTKGEAGTGIGLYISKTIIEQNMHGKLSAENHEDGALFTLELKHNA